jgi:alkanesulfonate monooxygenase SsuD/methylene tetrahydromethanopterin reductase-like flavin-dependent oxidoreductase (luciferase family)
MKFGVFDHLDDAGVPHGELYANRLRLAEAYDRAGFHAYHLAEHHGTPIGCAASPGLFLAALAQRTTRLRFGPLVYLLPFYHPLRLLEEISMLDHMSGGRLELGIGRGVSPFETANYALDFAQTQAMYHEAFQLLLTGFAVDELSFAGKFYRFNKVPVTLHPLQRPHPPLWYGVALPQNADWPAANDVNIVSLAPPEEVRPIFDRYLFERKRLNKDASTLLGVGRHVVVAETDEAALEVARRAYTRWRANFFWLFERHGSAPRVAGHYPKAFDELAERGSAVAGAPAKVRDFIANDIKATRANYFTPWLAFGDMTLDESLGSVALFAREVMPAFA